MLTKMRFPIDMNIIITPFSYIIVIIFSIPITRSRIFGRVANTVGLSVTDSPNWCYAPNLNRQSDQGIVSIASSRQCHHASSTWSPLFFFWINQFPILYIDRHKAGSARKHKYPLFSLTGEENNHM